MCNGTVPSRPTSLQYILFNKNVLAQLLFKKLQNHLFTKQIPSHVILQTGTNQWQQHYKENVLVELFFVIITKIITNLEDRNLLKLRSLDPFFFFFLSDNHIWDNELRCSKCYDRKAKVAFRTSNAVSAKPRRNLLTSLFKEVRVFKENKRSFRNFPRNLLRNLPRNSLRSFPCFPGR